MNALFAIMTASLVVFGGARVEGPLDEVLARQQAECSGERPGPDCGLLRSELELRLYDDLRQLYRLGEDVDRDTLRTAAAANFPQLALLALQWMREKPVDGDNAAIAKALDSRSPGVRSAAVALLRDHPPLVVRLLGDWILTSPYSQDEDLVPDADPDADMLGFAPYPGARLIRLASGKKRAFYTTADPPQKVLATIGKGKTVLDNNALYPRFSEALVTPDYEALEAKMQKMLTETDPEKLAAMQAEMDKAMQPQSKEMDLISEFGEVMSHSDAHFVILREQPGSTPGAPAQATRIAAVFHDDALGATVILVPLQ